MNTVQRNVPATATTLAATYGWLVAETIDEVPADWPGLVVPAIVLVAGFGAALIGKVAQHWTTPFVGS